MTQTPTYCEVLETWPEFVWHCNVCGCDVGDGPCPEHAPTHVPGLVLVRCEKDPRHNIFIYANEIAEEYPVGCSACYAADLGESVLRLTHVAHRWWRRSRTVRRALSVAYGLGLLRGYGTRHNLYCHGCVDAVYPGNPIKIWRERREQRAFDRWLNAPED